MASMMLWTNDLMSLISFFSFTHWIFYVIILSLIIMLRKTRPNAHRPFRVLYYSVVTFSLKVD